MKYKSRLTGLYIQVGKTGIPLETAEIYPVTGVKAPNQPSKVLTCIAIALRQFLS